jgi:hypothetical protein
LAGLLASGGFDEIRLWTYGFPLGYVLDWARNVIAARSPIRGSMDERSAVSGRHLQPPDNLGWATQLASLPFRLLQRPFFPTELGTGLVALARCAE